MSRAKCQIRKSLLSLDHVVKGIIEPRPTPILTCFCLTVVSGQLATLAVWPIATYLETPS